MRKPPAGNGRGRHARAVVLALSSLPFAAGAAAAGAGPTLDPGVAFASVLGPHRVVVRNVGHEHVSSGVVAEWMGEPDGADGRARVLHTKRLVEPGWYSLGPPTLTAKGNRTRVRLRGSHTYSGDKVSCVFDLRAGGAVSVVKACGPP